MRPSAISLMPEKLLDTLEYQEIRDLFAYMQSEPGKKAPPKDMPNAKPKDLLKVLLISGSLEYKSDESLAAFQKYLEANYPVECSRAFRKTDDDIPGLEVLDTCDVAVFFTRRLTIKGEQLERVKKYATSGKPIVAVRTASHGFQNWLEMDKEVFGGNYKGHFGAGPNCDVKFADTGKDHPVLKNVKPFTSSGSLYKNPDINKDVTILMTGSIPNQSEPITWVRDYQGGRVFYTSLGHPDDFKNDTFLRLLVNALFWTAKKDFPAN
jgi:type 1 glutamine amidotransferase